MSLPNSVIDALVASGCTTEQLAAAMKAANGDNDARSARKREVDAARRAIRWDITEPEWWAIRATVFSRDGHVCAYCGDRDGPHQIDHVIPVSRGGKSVVDNLSVACGPCNASKCDLLLSEWKGRI